MADDKYFQDEYIDIDFLPEEGEDFSLEGLSTEEINRIIDKQFDNLFKPIKCECGAEKTKTTHSDWCPKYTC